MLLLQHVVVHVKVAMYFDATLLMRTVLLLSMMAIMADDNNYDNVYDDVNMWLTGHGVRATAHSILFACCNFHYLIICILS